MVKTNQLKLLQSTIWRQINTGKWITLVRISCFNFKPWVFVNQIFKYSLKYLQMFKTKVIQNVRLSHLTYCLECISAGRMCASGIYSSIHSRWLSSERELASRMDQQNALIMCVCVYGLSAKFWPFLTSNRVAAPRRVQKLCQLKFYLRNEIICVFITIVMHIHISVCCYCDYDAGMRHICVDFIDLNRSKSYVVLVSAHNQHFIVVD